MKDLIVTLADKNYIDQAKQLFSSVYWNAGWKGDYMLLAHEIPEKDLKWFRDKGILVKKCKPLYDKEIGKGKFKHPPVVLDKFYLFTPEFKKWKNIVYLDADIIVRGSLDKLTNIKGLWAGAAIFSLSGQFSDDKELYEELKKKYDLTCPSFNTGVLAFSANIINEGLFGGFISLFNRYKDISIIADEGIFNLLFYKKLNKLSWLYETDVTTMLYFKVKPEKIRGIILHFIMNYPWNKNHPFHSEWISNLEKADSINLNNRMPPRGYIPNIFFPRYFKIKQGLKANP